MTHPIPLFKILSLTINGLLDHGRFQDEGVHLRQVLVVLVVEVVVAGIVGEQQVGVPAHHEQGAHRAVQVVDGATGIWIVVEVVAFFNNNNN